jgi:L-fuculose-phosphate aldolase
MDLPKDPAIRAALVAAGVRLGARGLISAGEGNFSARLGPDRILISPSGRRKDELAPADLLVVAVDSRGADEAKEPGARPSSDVAIHRAIYAARPDVRAVVHAHVPAAMALTLAGIAPDPAVLPETALLLPTLPFVPFGEMGSQELADRIAAALTTEAQGAGGARPRAVVLERHGAVAVGTNRDPAWAVAEAVDALELVDVLCRVIRDATLLRAAR